MHIESRKRPACLAVALLLAALGAGEPEVPLRVFAANHVAVEMQAIAGAYAKTGVAKPEVVAGGNEELGKRIRAGEPFDVLVASDMALPAALASEGLADSVACLASEGLVLWQAKAPARQVTALADLDTPAFAATRIAMADPDSSEWGAEAKAALVQAGLWEKLGARIVVVPKVRQCADRVEKGKADVALVPATRVPRDRGRAVPVADGHGRSLGIVRIAAGRHADAARRFMAFCTGPEPAAILRASGFSPCNTMTPTSSAGSPSP